MDIRRTGGVAAVAVVLAGLALSPARADDSPEDRKSEVDAAVRDLNARVDESAEQVRAAGAALDTAEARLVPAREALASAQSGLAAASAVEAEASARLADTVALAESTAREYENTLASIQGHEHAVGAMARQAYMGGGLSRLRVAMNSTTPAELTSAMAYLRAVNRSERAVLSELDDARRELAMKRAELAAVQERVEVEQDTAQAALEAREAATATAAEAESAVEALVAQRSTELGDAEDLKAEIERRYQEMKAESDRLAQIIAERAAEARRLAERVGDRGGKKDKGGSDRRDRGGVLSYPVVGPITSPYGMRYHPILGRDKLHTGTDFGVPEGTPVRSAMGGRVLEAYYNSAYGNRVIVEHGLVRGVHLVTTYNHMTRDTVREGERLDRGEVLGYVGSTGWSTGPHLHFETLEDGDFVDPMRWLR